MRSASPDTTAKAKDKGLKLLLWPLLAALLFGLVDFGEFAEDVLRVARNSLRQHPVSGEIVLVEVDESSLREIGNWPWPRATQAKVITEAKRLGAKRLFMDIVYANPSDAANDRAMRKALAQSRNVTLAVQSRIGEWTGKQDAAFPMPAFAEHAGLAAIGVYYNWQGAAWKVPYGATVQGRTMPSLAARMADAKGKMGEEFPIDYSLNIDSVPRVSASQLIKGQVDP